MEETIVKIPVEKQKSIRNELLCFVTDKCNLMGVQDIVKICDDFYKPDEVYAAKDLITSFAEARLPKRKGNDKKKFTLEDIVKTCLDPSLQLPQFFAVDLSRLPPVDIKHVDITAILRELSLLRAEVRALQEGVQRDCDARHGFCDQGTQTEGKQMYAEVLNSAGVNTSVVTKEDADHIKKVKQPVRNISLVGTKVSTLRTIERKRKVNVFLSRIDPAVTVDELINVLQSTPQFKICKQIECKPLATKTIDYASFHVTLTVDNTIFDEFVKEVYDPILWPAGSFFRRYFIKAVKNSTDVNEKVTQDAEHK